VHCRALIGVPVPISSPIPPFPAKNKRKKAKINAKKVQKTGHKALIPT
jgi:hypothetical protein